MLEPVAAMTGLIERLRDTGLHSAAEAADALEALRGYAGHDGETCDFAEPECSCGLSALLAKLGDA